MELTESLFRWIAATLLFLIWWRLGEIRDVLQERKDARLSERKAAEKVQRGA